MNIRGSQGNLRQIALQMVLEKPVAVTDKGCWLWTGEAAKSGYGFVAVSLGSDVRHYTVYRLVYEHYKGPIPVGQVRRHTCNVRLCVNPGHLITGSWKENTGDMIEAGRAAWQEKAPLVVSKVTGYMLLPERIKQSAASPGFAAYRPKPEEPTVSPEAAQVLANESARRISKRKNRSL